MSRKINVKVMDIESLSAYNKASFDIIRLNDERANALKPLKEEKASVLAKRAEALKVEGATLDDVLREFSTDKIDMAIEAVNFKYAEPLREATKAQNKVARLVNPNTFYAYAVSMASEDSNYNATGEYNYLNSKGDNVSIKIGASETFAKCIKKLYDDLGAVGTDDVKAINKVVQFHAKRVAGLKFKRATQELVLKNKSEIVNGLLRDVIEYIKSRGIIEVAEDGTITRVEKVAEEVA